MSYRSVTPSPLFSLGRTWENPKLTLRVVPHLCWASCGRVLRQMLTPPFLLDPSGRLVDALKNYEVIFYLAGSEVVLSAVFLAMATYCCLNREKKKTPPPEKPPSAGGGSDTEEAESDVQEGEEHSSDNHQPARSTDNAVVAASEEANHVEDEQSGEGGRCPEGDREVLAQAGCNADQTVERDSF